MDRFDICAAYNLYSILWGADRCAYENGIQCRLAKIAYKPSHSEEFLDGLSEDAQEVYLGLVLKHQGEESHEKERRLLRPEIGDLVVKLENSDDDPMQILVSVSGESAHKWAEHDQTIDGSSWECAADMPEYAYTILSWHPGLFEELAKEGYRFDHSKYCEPEEEEIRIATHAAECPSCEFDFRAAQAHLSRMQ